MGVTQIVILVLGALLFTASFIVPEKKSGGKESKVKEEQIIRETLDKELENYLPRIDEAASDAIERTKDVTERYMDKLTNEKMMAVNEYSDTVLEQIHKNHEEAMFLYDMLNNKHAQVKSAAAEVNSTVKNVRQISEQTKEQKKELSKEEPKKEPVKEEPTFEPIEAKKVEVIPVQKEKTKKAQKPEKQEKEEKPKKLKEDIAPLNINTQLGGGNNSNDRILELHKAGKSNMAIARELGLGIGEVKLVIDLFEG